MPVVADPRLMVALDFDSADAARALVSALGAEVSVYKIGLTLLARDGVALAHELRASGKQVFQDWKLHDIGAQVEGAARSVCEGGCDFLTVHAEPQVMRAAVRGRGSATTKLLGVTVMTSLTDADLTEMGYGFTTRDLILRRVDQALDCGLDGVVASPLEAELIRPRVPADFLIVTPGVRPAEAAKDDQQRVATPGAALAAGASHLVIGRPITAVADPVASARAILEEMAAH
ncbi:MAG: orotidine-5'-phosphate decarboxylase [Asticcacaulis sp.]